MKRQVKIVTKALTSAGYRETRRNSKGFLVFSRGSDEVLVSPSLNEHSARRILTHIGADMGKGKKRSATKAKERQATERERAACEVARLDRERAQIIANRERRLDGHGSALSADESRAIERRIEEIDRERKRYTALMTQTPGGGAHSGTRRAQHRSGGRP